MREEGGGRREEVGVVGHRWEVCARLVLLLFIFKFQAKLYILVLLEGAKLHFKLLRKNIGSHK